MNNKITITILILAILMAVPTIASAQLVTPGVSKDDIFEYNYNVTWNSTNPNASVSSNIAELIQIKSFQIKITNVSGTTVNAEVTKRYRNDTTKTETGFVDVQSGSIHLPFGFLIIAGNLKANDTIYPTWEQATINETITRTYQTGNRETNKRIIEITSENSYEKTEVYYDKIKGITVDSYYESRDTYGSQTEIFTETITNTNSDAWTSITPPTPTPTTTPTPTSESVIPEFPTYAIPLILVAATASLLLVRGKKFSRKPSPI